LLPSTVKAAAHGDCHVGCVDDDATSARQPTRNAGHADSTRSSSHPGSAAKFAGVNAMRGGAAGGEIGGATWHAARMSATTSPTPHDRKVSERTMEWIYLEAAIALVLLIAIVWWTMAARHKPDRGGKPTTRERE
jgi:hypothetical protein